MLHITTWNWGLKYGPHYVSRLRAGVKRHLSQDYTFSVIEPLDEDRYLTEISGCFARLRAFDPLWQKARGFTPDDRVVILDLDAVITGPLDPLFDRSESFVILGGANSANPCPFNGSVTMLRPGFRPDVWLDFSLERAKKVPFYSFPDDQSWYSAMIPDAATWRAGPESGIYAFGKPGWPKGDDLPRDSRLVAFPGWRDPSAFIKLPWVKEHWRA